jgi:hypothetical protein
MDEFAVSADEVIAVETATGRTLRTVTLRRGGRYFLLKVSPDGRGLILQDEPDGLVLIDTASGRIRARLNGEVSSGWGINTVAGYTPHSRAAYILPSYLPAAAVRTSARIAPRIAPRIARGRSGHAARMTDRSGSADAGGGSEGRNRLKARRSARRFATYPLDFHRIPPG